MSLWVNVISVKNIPQPDTEQIVDPFVSLQLSSALQTQRTRVIENTNEPKFNQEFTFPLVNLSTDVLKCSLIDRKLFGENRDLAKVEVHVSDVPQGETLDKTYDMQSLYPSDKTTQIHLNLKLVTGPQPSMTPMMAQMMTMGQMQMNQNQQMMAQNMMMMQNSMMNTQMMGGNPMAAGQMNAQMMGSSMMNPQMMQMSGQMWPPYRYTGP